MNSSLGWEGVCRQLFQNSRHESPEESLILVEQMGRSLGAGLVDAKLIVFLTGSQ